MILVRLNISIKINTLKSVGGGYVDLSKISYYILSLLLKTGL